MNYGNIRIRQLARQLGVGNSTYSAERGFPRGRLDFDRYCDREPPRSATAKLWDSFELRAGRRCNGRVHRNVALVRSVFMGDRLSLA